MNYQEALKTFHNNEKYKPEKIYQIILQEMINNYITYLKKVRNNDTRN